MRILTALDRSEYAEIVLEHALDQGVRSSEAGLAELHVMTVVLDDADREAAHIWLDALVREGLDDFGLAGLPYTLHIVRGQRTGMIATLASQLHVDLLVIGRFHVPSISNTLVEIVDCPIMVVGIDGVELEAQCPACRDARRTTNGEQLFCDAHSGDRVPDLALRLGPSSLVSSRGMW